MSEYDKQAKDFLKATGTELIMQQIRPEVANRPSWATEEKIQHGYEYRVALVRNGKDYRFSFWDSIANAERNKKPTAYDILACLNPSHATTFQEFCDEYGYDSDSRQVFNQWQEVEKETKALHNLFSEAELDQLGEIQ